MSNEELLAAQLLLNGPYNLAQLMKQYPSTKHYIVHDHYNEEIGLSTLFLLREPIMIMEGLDDVYYRHYCSVEVWDDSWNIVKLKDVVQYIQEITTQLLEVK